MKPETREILERSFAPEQIKQRQGNFGQTLDYIEGHAVIERLNEAFEGDWSFEITWQHIGDDEVLIMGRLAATGIIKEQFGSSKVTRNRDDNSVISIGDDLKSATTDALKKAATLLGIGLHLYHSHQPYHSTGANYHNHHDKGNGNGGGNGRATTKQIKAIFAIAQDKGISNKDVRDLCVDACGKLPDYLTKSEASEIIQDISAR